MSALEFDETGSDRNLAAAERVEAVDTTEVARLEMREQEEALRLKTIHSPFDGVVLKRQHHPGEVTRADNRLPIIKVARINPLYRGVAEVVEVAAISFGGIRKKTDRRGRRRS